MKVISSDLECMKWVIIAKIFMISNSYSTEVKFLLDTFAAAEIGTI